MTRRAFFSFHYQPDVWRVWNVRNSWVVKPSDEQVDGFFDSSVFEASKRQNDESLKRFLREGLKKSSVTCVLAGTQTWSRRWVRYEIVQSVLKRNGLLTVDIHGVKNKEGITAAKGANPLAQIGLYRTSTGIYFAEWSNGKWIKYGDYSLSVSEADLWFKAPNSNSVIQLSTHCSRYDFTAQNGRTNIGNWIEIAAQQAGR
ncbi:MAG: TIR domain-containing protein [Gammaproteobacteria bacterium]|nr:TIR domain-containing protein [Gammaproteobacteria bacterium]